MASQVPIPPRFRPSTTVAAGWVLTIALLGSATWFAAGVIGAALRPRIEPGEPAPGFDLPTLGGERLSLDDLRGRVVLIDFFSLHCVGCVGATPRHNRLSARFDAAGLAVVGVNLDPREERAEVARYVAERPVEYPVALDPDGAVADAYGVGSLPAEILVDAQGRVRSRHQGLTSERAMTEEIEALLEE